MSAKPDEHEDSKDPDAKEEPAGGQSSLLDKEYHVLGGKLTLENILSALVGAAIIFVLGFIIILATRTPEPGPSQQDVRPISPAPTHSAQEPGLWVPAPKQPLGTAVDSTLPHANTMGPSQPPAVATPHNEPIGPSPPQHVPVNPKRFLGTLGTGRGALYAGAFLALVGVLSLGYAFSMHADLIRTLSDQNLDLEQGPEQESGQKPEEGPGQELKQESDFDLEQRPGQEPSSDPELKRGQETRQEPEQALTTEQGKDTRPEPDLVPENNAGQPQRTRNESLSPAETGAKSNTDPTVKPPVIPETPPDQASQNQSRTGKGTNVLTNIEPTCRPEDRPMYNQTCPAKPATQSNPVMKTEKPEAPSISRVEDVEAQGHTLNEQSAAVDAPWLDLSWVFKIPSVLLAGLISLPWAIWWALWTVGSFIWECYLFIWGFIVWMISPLFELIGVWASVPFIPIRILVSAAIVFVGRERDKAIRAAYAQKHKAAT